MWALDRHSSLTLSNGMLAEYQKKGRRGMGFWKPSFTSTVPRLCCGMNTFARLEEAFAVSKQKGSPKATSLQALCTLASIFVVAARHREDSSSDDAALEHLKKNLQSAFQQ
jgi:hypothetical protein